MGIKYQKIGYKYQLAENAHFDTPITGFRINLKYVTLETGGNLVVFKGYQWDGASGPTLDDNTNMRGSLVHDVLYQILREEELTQEYRKIADKVLFQILREDGMPWWRSKYYYWGVRIGGGPSADPKISAEIYEAP